MTTDISIIGLGRMGRAFTRTLIASGRTVTVWNRSEARCEPFVQLGAKSAKTPAEAISASETTILLLANPQATREVLAQPGVDDAVPGRVLIQLCTATSPSMREMQDHVTARRGCFVGGSIRAYPAQVGSPENLITLFGDREGYDRCASVLAPLGRLTHLTSSVELGAALSVAQSTVMYFMILGFLEALPFAIASGSTPEQLAQGLAQTWKMSENAITDIVECLRQDPRGRIPAQQASLYTHSAAMAGFVREIAATGCPTEVSSAISERLAAAVEQGLGAFELSALIDGAY